MGAGPMGPEAIAAGTDDTIYAAARSAEAHHMTGRMGYAQGSGEGAQSVIGTANTALNVDFAAPGIGFRWRVAMLQIYATGGAFANQVITVESPAATILW